MSAFEVHLSVSSIEGVLRRRGALRNDAVSVEAADVAVKIPELSACVCIADRCYANLFLHHAVGTTSCTSNRSAQRPYKPGRKV